ncbi:DUF2254 domain-containing protein [Paracoccus stylophorae]|uniref:DUF2254 domain-containing protein n=1 Tax=Paracoccus stylophorae TaxID=659350 RepID=A0ABY7SZN5_9RHOB|nr:DUF2254 domain-containing protein [Paracoccus stylophorae]WCR11721.1 DUF2254 domain-containing protein [Paracoccus stylophorae]
MGVGAGEISQLRFKIRELAQQTWVRVSAFAVLGILTAMIAFLVKDFIPDDLPAQIGADAIESILQILASSMLAVTTFSLSILTGAYASAGTTATPRAVRLLVADPVSQTVLATFIGAFLFSLVSIILLKTEIYGNSGRLVLFGVTLLVVLVVVVSLLRWIDKLGRLGRVGDTIGRVTAAAIEALEERLKAPWLGANPLRGAPPPEAEALCPKEVGFLQHCDMARLSELADEAQILIYLRATPGDFLSPATPVLSAHPMPQDAEKADKLRDRLLACMTIRDTRDFQQDPRFGLQVLSEIAQRALSPGINDPGTAILASGHMLKVMQTWQGDMPPVIEYPRLFVPSLTVDEMLEESFLPVARDGAANFQVQRSLQQILLALGEISPQLYGKSMADLSKKMLIYSQDAVALESHRSELASISARIMSVSQKVA